ncbi:glycosyltransferase family 2 protein [Verrucomicrobiota bacterium sgz303538]
MAANDVSTPRFSVITPSFNRASLIGEAIASVQAQDVADIEHIIIDGGSKDGTLDVLARFPHLQVVSEPDKGIYDALNKGLRRARGEIIALLNTDDMFAPGVFSQVAAAFEDPNIVAVHGGAEIYEDTPEGRRIIRRFLTRQEIDLSWENVTVGVGTINARFWRRSFLEQLGPFDLRYRISSDRELLIRAALATPRSAYLERIVYYYRLHPDSLTFNHGEPRWREEHLELCKRYLQQPGINREARYWFRRLHTKETIESTVTAGMQGKWQRAWSAALHGWRWDFHWPIRLAREVVLAAWRRISPPPALS